ncbi:helix-turn-helix domain-containing protein [Parasphingopyxis marina]|uniref:Helix-turn-helix domain-containing protein n=1 Tax=Parasphingopyxis marina TaxID=2761622 RepID=A0A842HZ00_9SPHN|nr:helix-turn-helix domain-containing protein [Parasphingopyxis marina]MBC2776724.1 helix-turn-helix domain-containing protein [Parasphingopyxis marina]
MTQSRSVIEGWPALLTTEMAARYLSVDEIKFAEIANRWRTDPVDLETDSPRWHRSDLDRLIWRLPCTTMADDLHRPRKIDLDKATIDHIVSAVASRLAGQRSDNKRLLVSIRDASEMLGVARTTIYRLISGGRLGTRRIGRRMLILMADIDAILVED